MRIKKTGRILATCVITISSVAQGSERKRPTEWESLAQGERYVAGFLPMANGKLSEKAGGTKAVIPHFVDNGIESPQTVPANYAHALKIEKQ